MPKRSPEYMESQRSRFCAAAVACFRRKGVSDSSLVDICEQSELSMGALYKHFSSRDELIEAVIEQRWAWRRDMLRGETWPGLRTALIEWRKYLEENPYWRELQSVISWNKKLLDARAREARLILFQIEQLLERYLVAGEIDPPFGTKRTPLLLSITIDGSVYDAQVSYELRLGPVELAAYLDFTVGAKTPAQPKPAGRLGR